MKTFQFIVLLGVCGTALGGGFSKCNPLIADFSALLQVSETSAYQYRNLSLTIAQSLPIIADSLTYSLDCELYEILKVLAAGASSMTNTPANTFEDIFFESISPPFAEPLDCIEDGLLSYTGIVSNFYSTLKWTILNYKQSAQVDSTTSCPAVSSYAVVFTSSFQNIIIDKINIANNFLSALTGINRGSLFGNYKQNVKTCYEYFFKEYHAKFLNANINGIVDYMTNSTFPIPPQVTCIGSSITAGWNTFQAAFN